jgi:predicted nicotinamide N-methyase
MAADPLTVSLTEQLTRMRGGGDLPEALLDVAAETVELDGASLTLVRPGDWDELRHQEGAAGRSAPYWATAWPSGLALAEALTTRDLAGRRVLELGCGLGLPSVVAAQRGASVVATDGEPDAVVFAAHNLALNGVEGEVAQVNWRERDAFAGGGPWDLVLAADVLYTRQNVEALLRLLPRLLEPGGEAIVADPKRAGGRDFLAAGRRMFRIESRPVPAHPPVQLHTLRRR